MTRSAYLTGLSAGAFFAAPAFEPNPIIAGLWMILAAVSMAVGATAYVNAIREEGRG